MIYKLNLWLRSAKVATCPFTSRTWCLTERATGTTSASFAASATVPWSILNIMTSKENFFVTTASWQSIYPLVTIARWRSREKEVSRCTLTVVRHWPGTRTASNVRFVRSRSSWTMSSSRTNSSAGLVTLKQTSTNVTNVPRLLLGLVILSVASFGTTRVLDVIDAKISSKMASSEFWGKKNSVIFALNQQHIRNHICQRLH